MGGLPSAKVEDEFQNSGPSCRLRFVKGRCRKAASQCLSRRSHAGLFLFTAPRIYLVITTVTRRWVRKANPETLVDDAAAKVLLKHRTKIPRSRGAIKSKGEMAELQNLLSDRRTSDTSAPIFEQSVRVPAIYQSSEYRNSIRTEERRPIFPCRTKISLTWVIVRTAIAAWKFRWVTPCG